MRKTRWRSGRRRRLVLAGSVLASAVLTVATVVVLAPADASAGRPGCQHPAAGAAALSCRPIPVDQSWRRHVLTVPSPSATPRSVSVDGAAAGVTNPNGLLGHGVTTLRTTAAGSTRIIVDMGRLVSGYVELDVVGATGGPVRMSYSEGRAYLGTWGDGDTDPESFYYHGRTLGTDDDPDGRADVFPAPTGRTTLRSPGLRGAQRYVAITLDGPGTLTVDGLRIRQTNLPGRYDGHFLSSDRTLTDAWYASAYAVDLSTVRDTRRNPGAPWVIIDGPKRDRTMYAGDLRVVGQAAYYQGDRYRQVMRDTINMWACQQRPDGTLPPTSLVDVPCTLGDPGPPDGSPAGYEPPGVAAQARVDSFTAWWVITVADYLEHTGDRSFVESLMPVARRAVDFFSRHAPDGVLWRTDTYGGAGFAGNWHTPDLAIGIDAYSNEAYYGALRAMARLERGVAHDNDAASALDDRAEAVKSELLSRLWDPTVGAFVLNTEDPARDHTADANVGALLFGLLDEQKADSVMSYLKTTLGSPYGTLTTTMADNPYMTQYVSPYILAEESMARFDHGDGAGALTLLRAAWGHMLRQGPGTPWEQIGPDGSPGGAGGIGDGGTGLAHAWSTAVPTLSMNVLGVRPVDNGYRTWSVAPQPVDLTWAQGDVPTPAGPISVRWHRGAHSFVMTVAAPARTSGTLTLPLLGKGKTVAMDGEVVWRDGGPVGGAHVRADGDTLVFDGVSGGHTIAWTDR